MKGLSLEESFHSILRDDKRGDNPIPEPLRFSYISLNKEKIFNNLNEKIKKGTYLPASLLTVDVPKSNYTIRPMARPEIFDWIIYQALVEILIPKIVKKASKRSFSILNFKDSKSSVNSWKKFDDKSRQLYAAGYPFVVSTDISSYFENIDLVQLRQKLINHVDSGNEDIIEVINFLCNKQLLPWSSGRVKNFGLLQGPTASSFLGDIYLDNVDREMESEIGYYRYMDDIRIFCKTETEAKKALIKIIKCLRKYKLNINAKKTRILREKQLEEKLFDSKKDILDSIEKAIRSREKPKIQAILPILVKDVFRGAFDEKNPFDTRHIRFAIFRLAQLKVSGFDFDEEFVVNLIFDNFVKKPQHANLFCSFFVLIPGNKKISNFLIDFIFSKENIYEWQELHVLRALLEMNIKFEKKLLKKFYTRFKDKNRHWATRSLYCLLLGKHGKNQDRELIIDEYSGLEPDEFKQNAILAVQQLGQASRDSFYKRIKGGDSEFFINYIKDLRNPMYLRPYDKITIDSFEIKKEKYY